jgi:hypothetical protein
MIIGIDIGVTGCIAVLSASGELIEVHTMPCRRPRRPARGERATVGFDRLRLARDARLRL